MSSHRINLTLWSMTALLTVAVPIIAVVGVAGPLTTATAPPTPPSAESAAQRRPAYATTQDVPTIASFGDALTRALRPSLDRAAAGGPVKAAVLDAPVAAPAALRLVGSVGDSVAMIKGPDGTIALVEVGDDVDGADVIAIGPTHVELRQDGRHIVLEKPPAPDVSGVTIR